MLNKVKANYKKWSDDDVDIDMVPIMNMFLVLIPFLLMSASFIHLKAINTSVPVISKSNDSDDYEKQIKVMAIIELNEKTIKMSASSEELSFEELKGFENSIAKNLFDQNKFDQIESFLIIIKEKYPKSDTLVIIPDENIKYDYIIKTMDVARGEKKEPIFANIVISGKV